MDDKASLTQVERVLVRHYETSNSPTPRSASKATGMSEAWCAVQWQKLRLRAGQRLDSRGEHMEDVEREMGPLFDALQEAERANERAHEAVNRWLDECGFAERLRPCSMATYEDSVACWIGSPSLSRSRSIRLAWGWDDDGQMSAVAMSGSYGMQITYAVARADTVPDALRGLLAMPHNEIPASFLRQPGEE